MLCNCRYFLCVFACVQNMAFQGDQKVKMEILRSLGTDQLFCLLSDTDANVLMKTLGLLRNLLSTRPVSHVDSYKHFCQCSKYQQSVQQSQGIVAQLYLAVRYCVLDQSSSFDSHSSIEDDFCVKCIKQMLCFLAFIGTRCMIWPMNVLTWFNSVSALQFKWPT